MVRTRRSSALQSEKVPDPVKEPEKIPVIQEQHIDQSCINKSDKCDSPGDNDKNVKEKTNEVQITDKLVNNSKVDNFDRPLENLVEIKNNHASDEVDKQSLVNSEIKLNGHVVEQNNNSQNEIKKKKKRNRHRKNNENQSSTSQLPRGGNVSGRFWKQPKTRMSQDIVKHRPKNYKSRQIIDRQVRDRIKAYQKEIRENIIQEKKERKERLAEKIRRRAENEKKSEIVQVIKNTDKLRKVKKKHLRILETRDTLTMDTNTAVRNRRKF